VNRQVDVHDCGEGSGLMVDGTAGLDVFVGAICLIIALTIAAWAVKTLLRRRDARQWGAPWWGLSLGFAGSLLALWVGASFIWSAYNVRSVEFTVGRLYENNDSFYVYDTDGKRVQSRESVFADLVIGERVVCQITEQLVPVFAGSLISCARSSRSAGAAGRRARRCAEGSQEGAAYGAYNASESCFSADSSTAESQSWGMSDSSFLLLLALAAGSVALPMLVIARIGLGATGAPSGGRRDDVYELAMLAGGMRRVQTAALVNLHAAGALRLERGALAVADTERDNGALTDPVEREIVQALHETPRLSARGLHRRLRHGAASTSLRTALARAGLTIAPWSRVSVRGLGASLCALATVGIARVLWSAESPPDGPMKGAALGIISVTGALILGLICVFVWFRQNTRAGDVMIDSARSRHNSLRENPPTEGDLALAVALFGDEPLLRGAMPGLAAAVGAEATRDFDFDFDIGD
jgi:uncharacterized protein (TIGR04222 family)